MEESRVTTVEIFGREYKIKGVADQTYIQRVAGYVDEKMREVASAATAAATDRVAILAALNIADELFQARQQQSTEWQDVERKTESLISMLDESLQAND